MSENPLSSTVTVLHGDNRLEIAERVIEARESIDPTALSTSVFENATQSLADVASAVGSPGFFGSDRLVICHNLIVPASGGRRRKSSRSDDDSDPLSVLKNIAPGVFVLLIEDSLTATDERRLRAFVSDLRVEGVLVPRGRALIDWTCERARRHRAMIDGATAGRLVEALFPGTWRQASRRDDSPPDLFRLDTELAKLAAAAGEHAKITAEHVSDLVPEADALDIWGLTNAIADRDQPKAIQQLEVALENGQAAEMILGQLSAQFETFAVLNAARGLPNAEIASRTGLSEGRVRQAGRAARNYARVDLVHALREIRDVDFGIKQGKFEPEDALAYLVASLAQRPGLSHR